MKMEKFKDEKGVGWKKKEIELSEKFNKSYFGKDKDWIIRKDVKESIKNLKKELKNKFLEMLSVDLCDEDKRNTEIDKAFEKHIGDLK